MFVLTEVDRQKINSRICLDNGCWDWLGTKDKDGYSIVWLNGKNVKLHRLMYFLKNNKLDQTLQVAHLCNNRFCSNPDHLVQQTHQDNIQYRGQCNRTASHKGSSNGNSKLNEEQITLLFMKLINGEFSNTNDICQYFKVSKSIICHILNGKYWIDVSKPILDAHNLKYNQLRSCFK